VVTVRAEPSGDGWSCEVSVAQAGERTQNSVSVTRADLERWGDGTAQENVERLVQRSFEFLLEREPPSAILRRFELSVIPRYFPEYDPAMKRT
jgi:hypothetical protein